VASAEGGGFSFALGDFEGGLGFSFSLRCASGEGEAFARGFVC